jgi:tetratricopeptide (TPR) repeat protein
MDFLSNDLKKLMVKGNLLTEQGQFKEAIEYYNRTLAIDDSFLEAWYRKGLILNKLNQFYEAIFCFNKCIENPDSDFYFKALWNKGLSLDKVGQKKESRTTLDKAEREYTGYPFFDSLYDTCQLNFDLAIAYSHDDAFTSEFDLSNQSNEIEFEDLTDADLEPPVIVEDSDEWCPKIRSICPVEEFPSRSCPFGTCIYRDEEDGYDNIDYSDE